MATIGTSLGASDHLGAWKARWGIGRMKYLVPAGLYGIGTPGAGDPVLVTANYKMSFDLVRQSLAGRNIWLLVLETYGINVWCAAGKGTFGTDELVQRIASSRLGEIVTHRRLLLPILSAPGVAAHEVAKRSGFSITYATLRADDLPEYLDNGMMTTPAMKKMTFSLYERLVLVPVELVLALKPLSIIAALIFGAAVLLHGPTVAAVVLGGFVGAVFTGAALVPILLPYIPGRSFAVKGALAGVAFTVIFRGLMNGPHWPVVVTTAAILFLPAVSAFYALNFTGCTTFTSRSGVKKEMRLALPIMGSMVCVALLLVVLNVVW